MLQLSETLIGQPVISLRTSAAVATTTAPIINPNNLKIEGFYCQDRYKKNILVLLYQDIRNVMPQGLVINDYDVLSEPQELIRLQEVMKLHFEIINKPVVTVSKDKVGKVSDYATEVETMYIQKVYVSQSVFKSFTGGNLSIDRSQIVEITNKQIIINDLLKGAPAGATAVI